MKTRLKIYFSINFKTTNHLSFTDPPRVFFFVFSNLFALFLPFSSFFSHPNFCFSLLLSVFHTCRPAYYYVYKPANCSNFDIRKNFQKKNFLTTRSSLSNQENKLFRARNEGGENSKKVIVSRVRFLGIFLQIFLQIFQTLQTSASKVFRFTLRASR